MVTRPVRDPQTQKMLKAEARKASGEFSTEGIRVRTGKVVRTNGSTRIVTHDAAKDAS